MFIEISILDLRKIEYLPGRLRESFPAACPVFMREEEKMRDKMQEALKTAVNVYLVLILLVLPLYMQDGYVMIGDAKYYFFRNVTLLFMFITTVMFIVLTAVQGREKEKLIFSRTDLAVLFYGGSAVVSWCFAADRHMAWRGAQDWYMGLLSELMFVWIFFAASRWCSDFKGVLRAAFAGAAAVMALGILNRHGFDPLSVYAGLDHWNREHLLSTIGNQNWYCGYVSVASAVCVCFACAGSGCRRGAGLAGSLLFFWTILTQGSEGGYLILLAEMAAAFFWSLNDRKKVLAFLSVSACCPAAALLGQYCIRFRGLMLVEDGTFRGFVFWKGWPFTLIFIAGLYTLLWHREKKGCTDRLKSGKIKRAVLRASGIFFVLGVVIFIACQIWESVWIFFGAKSMLRISDSWGNGRGALWRMGLGCFAQGSFLDQWIGVGPDCFGNVVYAMYPVNEIIHATGQWEGAFFANAHNEWLNMLINQGILGLFFYAGIFVTLFVRLWKDSGRNPSALLGILAISGYCAYGTVSFQQAVSTPLIFAVLGISEGMLRNGEKEIK